nr:MAG TPA_asm: hypothetical protein [Bacteriophage sp.]
MTSKNEVTRMPFPHSRMQIKTRRNTATSSPR